jgi:hypothetical protein
MNHHIYIERKGQPANQWVWRGSRDRAISQAEVMLANDSLALEAIVMNDDGFPVWRRRRTGEVG